MLARAVILSLLPAFVSAEYKLKFLGDYQTGAWDTDAAENVAFDYASKRAFIASAKATQIQVVDLANPTAPAQTGALDVAGSLCKPALPQRTLSSTCTPHR